ncbi:uncharacterized protein B0H18DRAFT_985167 [Fomitopsis serialis]|uniref:uncharacterized protein n=1 Tax=Fomitopsis serialis TaxID=139415 RepID=UPI0020075F3B|nr:uncharacterized protein B0H18DRAFT_985167 [Neoantrodia serialis]KAH9933020.1 hypothetical protein B0H18DRAFT_985167 [Neoantrodia serialis]
MIIDGATAVDPFSDEQASVGDVEPPEYASRAASSIRSSRRVHVATQPPRYVHIERPNKPLTYEFMSWNMKSMLLVPPRSVDPGRGALYFISVALNLNPFAPLSYVTSLYRGSDAEGEFIGEFELGITHSRATISIGNHSTRLKNILTSDARFRELFTWRYETVELRWDCRTKLDDGSRMCICSDAASHQLASFVPPPLDASPPLPNATLTVFPDGHRHQLFDHIVLSALVVERKMTLTV